MQPMSADDVAEGLARVCGEVPTNGLIEIAGPEEMGIDEAARRYLHAIGDAREVYTDPNARYYGIRVTERSLLPGDNARLATTRLDAWLASTAKSAVTAV